MRFNQYAVDGSYIWFPWLSFQHLCLHLKWCFKMDHEVFYLLWKILAMLYSELISSKWFSLLMWTKTCISYCGQSQEDCNHENMHIILRIITRRLQPSMSFLGWLDIIFTMPCNIHYPSDRRCHKIWYINL